MKIQIDEKVPTPLKTDELINWSSPVWSPEGDNLLFSAREAREPMDIEAEYRMVLMDLDTEQKQCIRIAQSI